MPTEEWRPVPGFPDYEISSFGRLKSLRSGCVMTGTFPDRHGYLRARFRVSGRVASAYLHTLVAEAFHGPRPEGMETRHFDGDLQNNHADNLQWGTKIQNEQDKLRHGNNSWANRTHCSRGHEYTAENTTYRPSKPNKRICRTCARMYAKNRAFRAAAVAA